MAWYKGKATTDLIVASFDALLPLVSAVGELCSFSCADFPASSSQDRLGLFFKIVNISPTCPKAPLI